MSDEIDQVLPEPSSDPIGIAHPDASAILRMFTDAYDAMAPRNQRVASCRDLRRGTLQVGVHPRWAVRFHQAAAFVQSLLPERRTLERSVAASVTAVEPVFSRGTGDTNEERNQAEWAEFYLNELRARRFPFRQLGGKLTEDGELALVVLPDAATLDGCPIYEDTVTAAQYKTLSASAKKTYRPYGAAKPGPSVTRYIKLEGTWSDGEPKEAKNPEYGRDASGRRADDPYYSEHGAPTFKRDEQKSNAAFDEALKRYRAAHLPVTTLIMPALDVAPLLVRSREDGQWALAAMVCRTLLVREEAIKQGYRWTGMGDRLLVPTGSDRSKLAGQRGMVFVYQCFMTETDADGFRHPLILSCVCGTDPSTRDDDASASNVDVIDLYDQFGIEVPLWDYLGGMSTKDDDPAYAYEPWIAPFVNRILKIEGVETLTDMTAWENANTGYLQEPDPRFSDDVLLDASGQLRVTPIPEPGEVAQSTGPVHPFAEQRVNPDFRFREQALRENLAAQTVAEQTGPSGGESGHQLVVAHTLSIVAKEDIRQGCLRAARLFARASARILDALAEQGIAWPIETTEDRPIGGKTINKGSLIEWSKDWCQGSYEFGVDYPSEANPVEVSLAMQAWQVHAGSWEDLQKARGKADPMTERLKVAEDEYWESDLGKAQRWLRVAQIRRDKDAQKLAQLQLSKALSAVGLPGMEGGVPMGLLGGGPPSATPPGAMSPQPQQAGPPQPATAGAQYAGSVVGSNSGMGPAMNDARALSAIPGANGTQLPPTGLTGPG